MGEIPLEIASARFSFVLHDARKRYLQLLNLSYAIGNENIPSFRVRSNPAQGNYGIRPMINTVNRHRNC